MNVHMIEPELQALNLESRHHPKLLQLLQAQSEKDIYIQLMEVAAYCKVLVTGTYTKTEILELCKMLTTKLYTMRTQIILPKA